MEGPRHHELGVHQTGFAQDQYDNGIGLRGQRLLMHHPVQHRFEDLQHVPEGAGQGAGQEGQELAGHACAAARRR